MVLRTHIYKNRSPQNSMFLCKGREIRPERDYYNEGIDNQY